VSDPSKLSASLGDGAAAGVYSVNILDPGTFAASITQAEDFSGTHAFKLSLGGVVYGLSVADSSAAGVASAINSAYGDQVQATVVNVGSGATPDYRISLRGLKLGDLDPQILDGTDSLSDSAGTIKGIQASYTVNSSSVISTSDSRTFSIADGLTVSVQTGVTGNVDITVAPASSALTSALSSFANAYNTAADALAAHHGSSGGALTADPIVNQLSELLRSLGTYSDASGSVEGMKTLGLDLGTDGHLTFNQFTFASLNTADATGVAAFLGSSTTGGLLQLATGALNTVEQTDTGLLAIETASVQGGIANLTDQINNQQDRVDQLQTQLQAQMSAADSLIASMEQQYSYISNMFTAMETAAQQYK
jgi:flagellar hook-associated protein 2